MRHSLNVEEIESLIFFFTWIPLGEVEVREVDNIVCFLLFLVEESQLCWSAHNIVSDDTLIKRMGVK